MTETKADGLKGWILYSPVTKKHFFRVYNEDKTSFEDFDICAEDICVEICDEGNFISLYRREEGGKIDYSSRVKNQTGKLAQAITDEIDEEVLGKPPQARQKFFEELRGFCAKDNL